MINWSRAYQGLALAGYNDDQIAELAGLSRGTVNRVRNEDYDHPHEPGHAGGQRVISAINDALRLGLLEEDPLK
jgi:hypothetical protein